MNSISNVYIVGLGAVGSMVASKLHNKNLCDLKVVVDAERKKRYVSDGIYVNEKKYNFNFVSPEATKASADLIIVAVKSKDLEHTISMIKPFMGEHTCILSLLNGIDSESVLGLQFGMEHMLYSFIVATDTVRIKNRTNYTNVGRIVFGEQTPPIITPRVQIIKALLEDSGIPVEIPKDIIREMWWKFMLNVGLNQTSAILRAPYGIYQKSKAAQFFMRDACIEVLTIAKKKGINLTSEDIENYTSLIGGLSAEGKTSMLQDVEACRITEVETFAGSVIKMGKETDTLTPVNEILYKILKITEETYPV